MCVSDDINFSNMFYNCLSLSSIPDISKLNSKNSKITSDFLNSIN